MTKSDFMYKIHAIPMICACARLTGVFVVMETGWLWRQRDRWRRGGWLSVKHKSAGCIQVLQVWMCLCTLRSRIYPYMYLHLWQFNEFLNSFYTTLRVVKCVPEHLWLCLEGWNHSALWTWTHILLTSYDGTTQPLAEQQPLWPQVTNTR